LDAVPDAGWEFTSWTGDCVGLEDVTTVVMDSDKSCGATFKDTTVGTRTLTMSIQGEGQVVINQEMTCDTEAMGGCEGAAYAIDTPTVRLEATPNVEFNYQFVGWAGDCAAETAPRIEIAMDADKSCTAIFEPGGAAECPSDPPTAGRIVITDMGGTVMTASDRAMPRIPNGQYMVFAESFASQAGGAGLLGYNWDTDQDGTADAFGQETSFSLNVPGTPSRQIVLTVTDECGSQLEVPFLFNVCNAGDGNCPN
jgi:uncharacterized repeat protein (TIGR02543 family)